MPPLVKTESKRKMANIMHEKAAIQPVTRLDEIRPRGLPSAFQTNTFKQFFKSWLSLNLRGDSRESVNAYAYKAQGMTEKQLQISRQTLHLVF